MTWRFTVTNRNGDLIRFNQQTLGLNKQAPYLTNTKMVMEQQDVGIYGISYPTWSFHQLQTGFQDVSSKINAVKSH